MRISIKAAALFLAATISCEGIAASNIKTPSQIPCFSNKSNPIGYAVLLKNGIYESTSRLNFAYANGPINDPLVIVFYKEACEKRTERLAEHRVPSARLLMGGDPQSIWIDKDGNVEFDAWATSVPKEQGRKILSLLQEDAERIRRLKKAKDD